MTQNEIISRFREQNELHSGGGDFIYRLIQSIGDNLQDWELYADMVKRTSQAQALTAQELDLRNFFQHYNILFWTHPIWKIPEDQCFYVYDFAFRLVRDKKFISSQSLDSLPLKCPNLWLLECSYTTLKPGAARHFFRKRCIFIDQKFRAAKRRGMSTILLLEALNIPPSKLRRNLPRLDHIDVHFTSVEAFKEWVLEGLRQNGVFQKPPSHAPPKMESIEHTQTQLNGYMPASDPSSPSPRPSEGDHSLAHENDFISKRTGRKDQ